MLCSLQCCWVKALYTYTLLPPHWLKIRSDHEGRYRRQLVKGAINLHKIGLQKHLQLFNIQWFGRSCTSRGAACTATASPIQALSPKSTILPKSGNHVTVIIWPDKKSNILGLEGRDHWNLKSLSWWKMPRPSHFTFYIWAWGPKGLRKFE